MFHQGVPSEFQESTEEPKTVSSESTHNFMCCDENNVATVVKECSLWTSTRFQLEFPPGSLYYSIS